MRYPETVFAALASSAPLRCQLVGGSPNRTAEWTATDFWAVVTRTASPEAGADPACVPNSRAAFAALFNQAETPEVCGVGGLQLCWCVRLAGQRRVVDQARRRQLCADAYLPACRAAACRPCLPARLPPAMLPAKQGRRAIEAQLGLCPGALRSAADARVVALWLRNAWDTAAMSSTAAPSSYFTGAPLQAALPVG